MFSPILQRFLKGSPLTAMVRGILENILSPQKLDAIFEETAKFQYTRSLLFSSLVEMMCMVVTKVRPSIRAAYVAHSDRVDGSLSAVYEKLNHIEPEISREMVRRTAANAAEVVDALGTAEEPWVPGLQVRVVDGNKLAGTEHRLQVLRTTKQAALPGQSLAVLDPLRRLVLDVIPCEDAYAQERSLFDEVLEEVGADELWIADRNFCTSKFLLGIAERSSYFIIREHGQCFGYRMIGKSRRVGRCEKGEVREQTIEVIFQGTPWRLRRVSVVLDKPTSDGTTEIHLFTNLPLDMADGIVVAESYHRRWSIEGVFQIMTDSLRCEIDTLGYPRAALFGFCTALLAFNALSVAQAALQAAHGEKAAPEKISEYQVIVEVAAVYEGMEIALDPEVWQEVHPLTPRELARVLVDWAGKVKLSQFKKHKRGPKKPRPKRKSGKGSPHVSTARLLAEQEAQTTRAP